MLEDLYDIAMQHQEEFSASLKIKKPDSSKFLAFIRSNYTYNFDYVF